MTTRLVSIHSDGDHDLPGDAREEDDPLDVIGHLNELRERRISALEEVVAARWPRRWLLSLRMRRSLRQSVHSYGWTGQSWHNRRAAWMTGEWLAGRDRDRRADASERHPDGAERSSEGTGRIGRAMPGGRRASRSAMPRS
jgi:hypothetical protein